MAGVAFEQAYAGSEAITTTEWSLTTDTAGPDATANPGRFFPFVLMPSAATNADVFRFRGYRKVNASASVTMVWDVTAIGTGAAYVVALPEIVSAEDWDVTAIKISGTDRTLNWSIDEETAASGGSVNVGTIVGVTPVIDAGGSLVINAGGSIAASLLSSRVTGTIQLEAGGTVVIASGGLVDLIWDEPTAGHSTAGTTGKALTDAGSAGDPWGTALPGAYGAGTAGKIIGDNLNATVGSRLAAAAINVDGSGYVRIQDGTIGSATFAADGITRIQSGLATTANVSAVETDTQDIQSRLPAALVGGRMDASVGAMANDTLTAAALAASAVTEIQSGLALSTQVDELEGRIPSTIALSAGGVTVASLNAGTLVSATFGADGITRIQSGLATSSALANVQADTDDLQTKLTGTIQLSAGGTVVIDAVGMRAAVGLAAANLDTQLDAIPTAAEVTDAVWDEPTAGHTTAGTTGKALTDAGSAGDPWSTALPGAYAAGTAGKIIGDNLNATVGSRLAAASITLSGGAVTVGTNNDKTGYSLTQLFPANFSAMDITVDGTVAADVGGTLTVNLGTTDATKLDELHRIHGLKSGENLVVTSTSRVAGSINQTISSGGGTTTVSR